MADEFDRIARLRDRLQRPRSDVLVGIGDDAAILTPGTDNWVLSVDAAVEGVHFERSFIDLPTLAARAFTAAISDLAAMGSQPRAALLSLTLPQLSEAEFDALIEGFASAEDRYACPIVGGNLSAAKTLAISTTVMGSVPGLGMRRTGARPGDQLCVTGTLGSAALGLALLQRGAAEHGPSFVARWRVPHARIAEGLQLRGLATAAIDVSDGALQDLGHLCASSGVGAELLAEKVPLDEGFGELARQLGLDPLALALQGGEDYELLYTLPAGAPSLGPGRCIGRITAELGVRVLGADAAQLTLPAHGYRHFAG